MRIHVRSQNMACWKLFLVLVVSTLANGNPASLQDHYGSPAHGEHHGHAHQTDHAAHDSSSADSFAAAFNSGSGSTDGVERPSNIGGVVNDFGFASGNSGSFSSGSGINLGSGKSFATENSGADSTKTLFSPAAGTVGASILEPSNDGSGILINNEQFGEDITITKELTVDVFTTLLNTFYNSVPVTLTEFVKTTLVVPTLQVLSTPVDDHVYVATAPVTRTDTITVTDTNTAFQCATEVSTDFYTVTHRVYDIQQQLITSTVVQTQVFRPTVVSTRIDTEYDTETVFHTVTNTVVVNAGTPFAGRVSGGTFQQGTGFQQGAQSLINGTPQSGFVPFGQGHQNQHFATNDRREFLNHRSGSYY